MWHDNRFSQRNKTTKRAVDVEVGGDGGGATWQNLKMEGRQYRDGGLHKIEGLGTLYQLWVNDYGIHRKY